MLIVGRYIGGGTGIKLVPLSYVKLMQRLWIKGCRGISVFTTMQPLMGMGCMILVYQGGQVTCKCTDNK